nr:hypothetical protein CFP56_34422 [Quercus suber]
MEVSPLAGDTVPKEVAMDQPPTDPNMSGQSSSKEMVGEPEQVPDLGVVKNPEPEQTPGPTTTMVHEPEQIPDPTVTKKSTKTTTSPMTTGQVITQVIPKSETIDLTLETEVLQDPTKESKKASLHALDDAEIDKEINFRAATTVIQSEPFPVEGQILGSNPSLIRGGTTSYSFWNHHWAVKRQQERRARKKNCKHRRRVFLDVAPMKYLQPTIQMLSGTEFVPPGNEYQNLLLYLKSTITIPMSQAAKLVSMSALTIQKLPMQLLRPKYSLLTVTNNELEGGHPFYYIYRSQRTHIWLIDLTFLTFFPP